ncbi:hypothetical protein ACOJBM_41250 [Rhizobium beringeri]
MAANPGNRQIHQGLLHESLTVGDHHAPFGERRLRAHAEEAEACAGEHDEHRVAGCIGDDRSDRVGEHMMAGVWWAGE